MSLPLVCPYFTDPVHCFDDKTRKPCIGQCGHTVCLECITDRRFSRCPVCGLSRAFSQISVNYASIPLVEDCRNKFWEKWREWMDKKTTDLGFCSKLIKETQLLCSMCVEPVKIPRICLTCDEETLFKENWWEWKKRNAIVLKVLQRVMCSDCALNNHEGHKIVKHNMDKKSKKLITMALAQNVLNMFRDTIEKKKCVIDCFLRRLKIEMIGQNLLEVIEKLEYIEEWECGYLGELVRQELIKKYMENVDEKVLDLFSVQGNEVCGCSRFHKDLGTLSRTFEDVKIHRRVGIKPQVFDSGCPLYSWKYMADVRREYSISGEEFPGVASTIPPNKIDCPLCVYNGYSQHQRKYFLLENEVRIIEEICKTELIPLDKCCLNCLDRLNDCEFLLSCEHRKKKPHSFYFTKWKLPGNKKNCYQNCFIKDSTLWNFIIINHMMTDDNLHEVIIHEIEETVGFVDCQLRKVRMKETVKELYEGLNSARFWKYFDHLSKPIEMEALLENLENQWNSFRSVNGEQEAASQCKCTVIWNKVLEKKVEKEEYEDLESKVVEMARYSMTEEIHGCPMEYNHGIELNMDGMEELDDTVGFESTGQETALTLEGNKELKCLMERIASTIFPFVHLHCQNEEKQRFDNQIHQPYTGSCGHTICSHCVEKTHNRDCPVCGKERSFEGSQLNKELIREIETIKENAWEMFKELWNSAAADSGTCSKCNESSSDLYLCAINFNNFTIGTNWWKRFILKSTADVLKLSRQVLCPGCALVQADATKKVNSIPFWKNHLKKTNGVFLLELLEDDIDGENCDFRQIHIQKNRKQLIKKLEELNYETRQECGYDRGLIQLKLIEKLIEHIDLRAKQQQSIKENNCPLCVMIDFLDCAKNTNEHNRNDWMNVFEHLWSSQSPKFEKCCIRCLFYLNNRYSASCHTKTELENMKNISNAISEGIKGDQLNHFKRVLKYMQCNDCNNFVDDEETWKNLIIREYFFCLLQAITKGLYKTIFTCHLRKIRIYNLAYHFCSEVWEVWFQGNQHWIGCWRFIKTSSMVKTLNLQFTKIKSEMNKEEIEVKCECTEIWERNQRLMEKIGQEDDEKKRKLQYLEDSMEEMARFSLEEDLDECPMDYDHGIVLDEGIVKIK